MSNKSPTECSPLLSALKKLPAEQSDTILLLQQEFSLDEIAEITGVRRKTVQRRIRHALQHLHATSGVVQ